MRPGKVTYLTPFTAPPFRTHRRLPSPLNASETGNWPSEEMGSPIGRMFVGLRGSMANSDTVLEPDCRQQETETCVSLRRFTSHVKLTLTVARTRFFEDTWMAPCENNGSTPKSPLFAVTPCAPRPPAAIALSSLYSGY